MIVSNMFFQILIRTIDYRKVSQSNPSSHLEYVTQTDLNTNNNPVTKPGGFKLFNYNGSTYNIFFNTSVYNKNNEGNVNILESNPFKYGKYANNTFTYTQKNIIDNENQ
jgi:hypothetical protein